MDWISGGRFHDPLPEPRLTRGDTALVVIDMQFLDADPNHGIGLKLRREGRSAEMAFYFEEVARIIPRIRRLQDACRSRGIEIVHVRVCSLTKDGRDISRLHQSKSLKYAPGTKDVEFVPDIAPRSDEIVIDKTASGAFNSSNIDQVLRNLRISKLIVTGVDTCYCVETAVRDAADRGYEVVLVGDACATTSLELQRLALQRLDNDYCVVRTTEQTLLNIESSGRFVENEGALAQVAR